MAKIRNIKPEFWTSEDTASVSRDARLLFIGMWNFCDDNGVHPASYTRLKMEVLPADPCTVQEIEQWVNELINQKLLTYYEVDGKGYWHVTGWKHQGFIKNFYTKHPCLKHLSSPQGEEKGKKQSPKESLTDSKEELNTPEGIPKDSLRTPQGGLEREREREREKNKDLTPPSSSIHSLASDFFALFAADGFYLNKVNGNPETVDMVKAWIAAGVTAEEASAVIEQTKAKRNKPPGSPVYYRDIVLDAKRAGIAVVNKNFQEEIKKLFHEILPEYPINVWTNEAAKDLQARINASYENFDFKQIKAWRNFFLLVRCSSHIQKHEWHLDYLIREKTFANILNNKRQTDIEKFEKLKQQYVNLDEDKK